jgi:hypothetical protein
MGEPMTESNVYKDAVMHSADKAMANPTGFSRRARGTLTWRLLRTCLRNYLPTLPARRAAERRREGSREDNSGRLRGRRAIRPDALHGDAPDGADDTRESQAGDADFEKLTSHRRARPGHRAGFLNAR